MISESFCAQTFQSGDMIALVDITMIISTKMYADLDIGHPISEGFSTEHVHQH